ncbi:hypothetical protein [Azospirillum sp. SYSU D00513]|uniref:hypothetical protein n=1 Tax=Azospirillum sp. SYSU D00513 TaxID=2812561 RepID=UPI001A9634CF|nr:hypothetical protein [Azospirillum sp. SYSU D00513]
MEAFAIGTRPWGLYLAVQRPLNREEIGAFTNSFERACALLRSNGQGWGAVSDLRKAEIGTAPQWLLMRYMHLARQFGTGRTASLLSDWRAVAVFSEAIHAAGLAKQHRIVVTEEGDTGRPRHIYDWVLHGVEPPRLSPPESEAPALREWLSALALHDG